MACGSWYSTRSYLPGAWKYFQCLSVGNKIASGSWIVSWQYHANQFLPLSDDQIVEKVQSYLAACIPEFGNAMVVDRAVVRFPKAVTHFFPGTPSDPKWLCYFLDFFWSQNDCPVICPSRDLGSKSNIFAPNLLYQEVFRHHNFWERFGAFQEFLFSFWESYLQLFDQWSAGLNLAQVRNTDNHFGTKGVLHRFPPLYWHLIWQANAK